MRWRYLLLAALFGGVRPGPVRSPVLQVHAPATVGGHQGNINVRSDVSLLAHMG
jgi:hypothetical protein